MTKHHYAQGAGIAAPAKKPRSQTLTPRLHRALTALAHTQDWISREALDRIARASNGPAVVQALRHKLGSPDAIEMQRVPMTDADGKTAQAGRYRLSDTHRAKAISLLEARP